MNLKHCIGVLSRFSFLSVLVSLLMKEVQITYIYIYIYNALKELVYLKKRNFGKVKVRFHTFL